MTPEEIKKLLETDFQDADLFVSSEDNHHFDARVVSDGFEGKNPVARQRQVYQTLGEHIASGAIHALSLKTYTKKEWQEKCKN